MSRHLTPGELGDALSAGSPSGRVRVHLSECGDCATQLASLARLVGELETEDVPEPSPLYWGHASARIKARVAADAVPHGSKAMRWAWLTGLAGAAAVATVMMIARPPDTVPVADRTERSAVAVATFGDADDGSWPLVESAAGTLDVDEAVRAGLLGAGDTTDRAVLQLSADERAELGAMLEAELARSEI
jgi:hypothetical protein